MQSFFFMMTITTVVSTVCPPPDFHSKTVFNPEKYFNGTWYSIVQLEVAYQPLSGFFCTSATYTLEKTWWCSLTGCDDKIVVVNNRGTTGLNGPINQVTLQGIPSKEFPSQAKVGPRFLPSVLYGPYWIIEAGTFDDLLNDRALTSEKYEWSLVSGGPPTLAMGNGCLPGIGNKNYKGLWFLSRNPEPSAEGIEKVIALAHAKGFDTTTWKPVVQKGCTYKNDEDVKEALL